MVELATRRLTFQEFQELRLDGRYELVDGELEELVSPSMRHGWVSSRLTSALDQYLEEHDPEGSWGGDVDIPTAPFHGRRPDFLYFSSLSVRGMDLDEMCANATPALVAEVVSEDDPNRDLVSKRREYAEAGIAYYWILDPKRRTVQTLALREGSYVQEAFFGEGETLVSEIFPGLAIPLKRLFR